MATLLQGRTKDLDGFSVTRILPNSTKRMVGPFIFLDHMGPADFGAGDGIDVRPHPHIGLATITYLMEGSLLHRDSLGNQLEILPGDVNWMTAGRGIVHSERETLEVKAAPHRLNGMQAWVALPREQAEIVPSFSHIKRCELPHFMHAGVQMRLIIGEAYGMASPIKSYSPMFYLDAQMSSGAILPLPDGYEEQAVYVAIGEVELDGQVYGEGTMLVLKPNARPKITARCAARLMLLGGAPLDGERNLWWNFVSSSRDRIEQAKADWRAGNWPKVPGETEFIPLPEGM